MFLCMNESLRALLEKRKEKIRYHIKMLGQLSMSSKNDNFENVHPNLQV